MSRFVQMGSNLASPGGSSCAQASGRGCVRT